METSEGRTKNMEEKNENKYFFYFSYLVIFLAVCYFFLNKEVQWFKKEEKQFY